MTIARDLMCGRQGRRDRRVVPEEIALGDPEVGPERLSQVGEAHNAVADAHFDVVYVREDERTDLLRTRRH
jgi:hypothetical protein